jgi:hypothetical protein
MTSKPASQYAPSPARNRQSMRVTGV